MPRDIAKVGVIGLGTMGAGIAEVCARSGLTVIGVEPAEDALERGRQHVERSTARAVKRGKLTDEGKRSIFDALTFTTALTDVKDADLVIEAIPEQLALKQRLFAELDRICAPETILATNTSSLSITEIAAATARPARVVGAHFFNPAPVMRFVEIVTSVRTDPAVVRDVQALASRLGKVHVSIRDRAGFIANALLFGYLNRAVSMYESQYASREDIDLAVRLAGRLPMGPLALLDLVGLDTAHQILETMFGQSRNPLHAPAPLIQQMVTAGLLGRKSGRGFYRYDQSGAPIAEPDRAAAGQRPAGTPRPVSRIAVVGTGTRARVIAEACVAGGYEVTSLDSAAEADASLDDAGFVVGAGDDELSALQQLFGTLDRVCRPGTVLATTSARARVIECAAATTRRDDVVGLHFFDQPEIVPVVEVVSSVSSSDDAIATAWNVAERIGMQPVRCGDRAGLIVDALLFPYLNDAVKMLDAGYASADDIDAAMTLGCGYPVGPFQLLDDVGLDHALSVQRGLYLESCEPGLAPAPLLEQLVTAGYLGRKAGRGFRDYQT